jgi:hypothetical protein
MKCGDSIFRFLLTTQAGGSPLSRCLFLLPANLKVRRFQRQGRSMCFAPTCPVSPTAVDPCAHPAAR